MKLKASIDIVQLENGLSQITFDMKKVQSTSASVNSDFERMNQQANRLAVGLGLVGASTALLGLAKSAPQVAPALASIDLSMFKLSMTLGNIMKPAFDWVATKLSELADWASAHPDIFSVITYSIIGLSAALVAFKIGAIFEGFLAFFTGSGGAAILAGATAIYAIHDAFGSLFDLFGEKKNVQKDILQLLMGLTFGALGGALGSFLGPAGTVAGAGLGYAGGSAAAGWMYDQNQQRISSSNTQNTPTLTQSRQSTSTSSINLLQAMGIQNKYQSKQWFFLNSPGLIGR